ncbi:hypothetical protein GCM10007897_05790 [Sphingobium jiangsuense]|uniref:Alpha/beta hydrolase n=1 Tax=Sphingobium jiangsuense TaxID=870476 RepID=A0A7W6FPQ5_9SPHN|nr:hypothetical protein [Sphingobium jiangsuense]MBB3926085.1 hypothetical protein [Sphingobium jiangsuense]GLS99200.1 hypothetical protein GCM10007897_05790 [Sphingobium jiangsuense]
MRIISGLILACVALPALAQPAARPTGALTLAEARDLDGDLIREAYDKMVDMPGTGPYPAIKEVAATLSDHVVYRPADLAALGNRKMGVMIWGNGGCRNNGASARTHLLEIASYGYLVIAPGGNYTGTGAVAPPPLAPGAKQPKTTVDQVVQGLDWALAENRRKGSPYQGRIDEKAIAVAGHSCGGLQALKISEDPRIATTIVHNSGIFANNPRPVEGLYIDKGQLKKLHAPILYIMGGPTDVAYPNGTDDFRRIDTVPAVLVDMNTGHGGTFRTLLGGRAAQISVDWLEWQLRGDKSAGRSFTGPVCRLCVTGDLRVEKKGIDPE